jgi:hypothetical protein
MQRLASFDQYSCTAHSEQLLEFLGEYMPGAQVRHAEAVILLEYVPLGHTTHDMSPFSVPRQRGGSMYVPMGHDFRHLVQSISETPSVPEQPPLR